MRVLKVSWSFIGGVAFYLTAAALLYAYLAPSIPFLSRGQMQQAGQTEYRPGGSNCDPARLDLLKGTRAPVERERCQQAAEEYRLKTNDLVQQTRSAEAAEAVADLTFEQSQMMAAGTVVGFLTLVAAVYAVLYARRAAEEAGRSSNAAEGQLRESARVSAAELRPYLFVESIECEQLADRFFRCTVWFKNYGRTPARNIRTDIKAYMAESICEMRDFDDNDAFDLAVAAPGHTRRAFPVFDFTEEEWATPHWAFQAILRIRFSYEGEGGEIHEEEAAYFTGKHDLQEEGTTFFLLTEGAMRDHEVRRAKSKDLFDPEIIARMREDALRAQREERERQHREMQK
jgi:hypothetical protein